MSAQEPAPNASAATAATPTAGHWDYDEGDLSIYTMDDGGSLVFLFQPHDLCDGVVLPWAEMVANAQLIRSAPEMLEALQAVTDSAAWFDLSDSEQNLISTAIVLATGAA